MQDDSTRPIRKELLGGLAIGFILFAIAPFWLLGGGDSQELQHGNHQPGVSDQHPDDSSMRDVLNDVCPVSGEKLGSMGEPVIHHYQGQEVRLCCSGCISRFEKTPTKFMSQLMPKMTGEQDADIQQNVFCPFMQDGTDSMSKPKTDSCCGS